jgi:hypothetical protein
MDQAEKIDRIMGQLRQMKAMLCKTVFSGQSYDTSDHEYEEFHEAWNDIYDAVSGLLPSESLGLAKERR